MATHYAVIRSRNQEPFVIESHRHDDKSDFIERVFNQLAADEDKANRLVSFSIEFIFGD